MNNMNGVSVEMARMAKMSFCRWARERERPRERKLRKGEHSFRQLKFQIFATELHLHLYHLSTRVTQFVAVLFLQHYHIVLEINCFYMYLQQTLLLLSTLDKSHFTATQLDITWANMIFVKQSRQLLIS